MTAANWFNPKTGLLEIKGRGRLLPMEGMRGIAVGLVFLQHYCVQYLVDGRVTGATAIFAGAFRNYGNHGVELFFVLSGFLIYGILLKKQPSFLQFMLRRAQRLYPAFLVALLIAVALDRFRPVRLIPSHFSGAAVYLAANLAFLPGLFPITPISAVNWSLSYEWWFYAICTALFVGLGLKKLPTQWRIGLIATAGFTLVLASAAGIPNIPVRGLSLLAGMLLAEAAHHNWRSTSPIVATCLVAAVFLICPLQQTPDWLASLLLAISFLLLCNSAFFQDSWLSRSLSLKPLRWLGNISYSFYLVHGFVVVVILHFLAHVPANLINLIFWAGLSPVFVAAFAFSAGLFIVVEKPFSLNVRVTRGISAAPATVQAE